ncbi:hypothetical protein [Flavobacterium eburneipallidum]|uniref:hypothetical protein n=1 Tax=Flavobacterium eburneipallidum TaxID=3003263 RepID=UPI0022AC3FC3|nr:hypothetical protein [Flavobacterium eburneipallidum]
MNKLELFYGWTIGITMSILGCFLFVTFFTDFDFKTGIQILKAEGKLGKLITIGTILDLVAFAVLLKLNKETMARGVILAVICIAIFTIFA